MTCGDSECTRAPTFVLSVINNLHCWKSVCRICHVTEVSSLVLYVLSIHTSAVTATPVLLSLHWMGSCHQAEASIKRMAACLYLYIYPLTFYCNICHVIKVSGLFCHMSPTFFSAYIRSVRTSITALLLLHYYNINRILLSVSNVLWWPPGLFFFYIYPAVLQMLWCLPPVCSW